MVKRTRIVIIGAGGQARDAHEYCETLGHEVVGYVVTNLASPGKHASRERILGDYSWLHANRDRFDGLVLGIGNGSDRSRVADDLEPFFPGPAFWPSLVHPRAYVSRSARIGHGVLVAPLTYVSTNVVLSPFALLNYGTTGHEVEIGRAAVLCPGANLSGGVKVGAEAWIGTGAQVIQYLTIGDRATIGAGAVVTKDVPAGVTVVGVPARPMQLPQRLRVAAAR